MLKTEKIGKITSVFVSIAICALLILPVSAQFVDMLDYGLYYTKDNDIYTLVYSGGAGVQMQDVVSIVPMWALDSYELGTTYTFTFTCSITKWLYEDIDTNNICINLSHSPKITVSNQEQLSSAYRSISYDYTNNKITCTVKLNTDISDLGGYPVYIYLYAPLSAGKTYAGVTSNSWGTYAEVDSGGTEYIQSLVDEVTQIRQNDEAFYSSALQTLDEIKTGIDQMPGEIATVLEQHDQQTKQEASTEGNDNINQATSALTNALPIASISDAISPLITACSYNGITSVWSFPALKIPAIQGLFGEMQLSEQQNFDLCAYADQYIPDELLSIIRAVMTILLIVWAIREVMNLLSHLLGGGDG